MLHFHFSLHPWGPRHILRQHPKTAQLNQEPTTLTYDAYLRPKSQNSTDILKIKPTINTKLGNDYTITFVYHPYSTLYKKTLIFLRVLKFSLLQTRVTLKKINCYLVNNTCPDMGLYIWQYLKDPHQHQHPRGSHTVISASALREMWNKETCASRDLWILTSCIREYISNISKFYKHLRSPNGDASTAGANTGEFEHMHLLIPRS